MALQSATATDDERLLRELRAAPELADAREALAYWRRREEALAWHRRAARREARAMVLACERRVAEAMLAQGPATPRERLTAARELVASRGGRTVRRWTLRLCAAGACGAAAAGAGFAAVVQALGG